MFEIATSNQDAVRRVQERLQNDVGFFVNQCIQQRQAPFWALARTMFPIAESLAYLLYGDNPRGTAARLSRFIREELGSSNPNYIPLASIICQVWRHGLTHGDEPPFLVVGAITDATGARDFSSAKAMSWKLAFGAQNQHLQVQALNPQTSQFTFCLTTFFADLQLVTADTGRWSGFPSDEVKDRYNKWCSKFVDDPGQSAESQLAGDEIRALMP